jgi:hypothetical protein
VGKITYSEPHLSALELEGVPGALPTGVIVWFKPALVADESADVRQYALQNPMFPQQTTVDQWFDESQFESYRKLGELCALEAFGGLTTAERVRQQPRLRTADVAALFDELTKQVRRRSGGTAAHQLIKQ